MTLTLLAISLNERPLSQPITAHFDHNGGTIGRADHNTMALPDPERQISRLQAEIVANGKGFVIRNVSAANPITVAGRSIEQGESAEIAQGDEVRIGGYLLHVDCRDQDSALDVTRGRARLSGSHGAAAGAAAGGGGGANPFADLLAGEPAGGRPGHGGSSDPFADLMPPPVGIPAHSAGFAAAAPKAPARLPDDFEIDPFKRAPTPASAPHPPASSSADPFADLFPASAAPSIDQMFNLGPGAPDALARFMADAPAASNANNAAAGGVALDPLALFPAAGAAPAAAPAQAPAEPNHVPDLHAAFVPPRAVAAATPRPAPAAPARPAAAAPAAPPAPAVPAIATAPAAAAAPAAAPAPTARRAPAAAADEGDPAARLWAALCEGAGIAVPLQAGQAEAQMREAGRILRSAVEGAIGLMAVRAKTRHELRATVTVIQRSNNNPLKFSLDDPRAGLESLLQPTMRGFLQGHAAMDDAMHDLLGHAIGTMAGMRAAIDGLLERYSPQVLEEKLTAKSLLDSVLPMNRKAKLWDLYQQHNEAIRAEAQEDFDSLFGKAFLEAYEQQIAQLRGKGRA